MLTNHHDHNYAYPSVSGTKRAGSTAGGERHHSTIVVQSQPQGMTQSKINTISTSNKFGGGATDYSYNIGPTQYKQTIGPKNATKFSELKFHHTALDFNKSQMSASHNNGSLIQGNATQLISSSQKYQSVGPKKGNNSIDLGSKAAAHNITQNVMNQKASGSSSYQQKQNLQYNYTQ